jgi:hypothetical protein
VHTVLGLIGVAAFIVVIISLAAAITWAVVRISPTDKGEAAPKPPASS